MVLRNVTKQFTFEQQRQEINQIAVDLDSINTTLTNYNASNWDTAYSWGNHASAGYWVQNTTKISNWDTAYGWGNHASAGYLTSQTSHADVVVDGDFTSTGLMKRGATAGSYSVITDNSTNWDTAYGWGNHASAGYLTSVGSINNATDVTISSVANNQLLKYNSTTSQWENWTPTYLTSVPTQIKIESGNTSVTAVDPGVGGYIITLVDGVERQRTDSTWLYIGHNATGINWTSADGSASNVYATISREGTSGTLSFNADPSNVHSGSEFIFNVDSVERLKISNTGNTTISDGNLVIGTTGRGISFAIDSSAAGMTSELLDDYEEGTYTPTLTFASGSAAYSNQVGGYVKVGNLVHVYGLISCSSVNGTSGSVSLSGFPFPTKNTVLHYHAPAIGWYQNLTGITANGLGLDMAPNATSHFIQYGNGTGTTTLLASNISNTFAVEWAFTYRTD